MGARDFPAMLFNLPLLRLFDCSGLGSHCLACHLQCSAQAQWTSIINRNTIKHITMIPHESIRAAIAFHPTTTFAQEPPQRWEPMKIAYEAGVFQGSGTPPPTETDIRCSFSEKAREALGNLIGKFQFQRLQLVPLRNLLRLPW